MAEWTDWEMLVFWIVVGAVLYTIEKKVL